MGITPCWFPNSEISGSKLWPAHRNLSQVLASFFGLCAKGFSMRPYYLNQNGL